MLSYDEFKERIAEDIFKYLPETFYKMGAEVEFTRVYQNNKIMENMILRDTEKNCFPSINLDSAYMEYLAGYDEQPDAELKKMADMIVRAYKDMPETDFKDIILNTENVKSKIYPMFVNYEDNEEMVLQMPHRRHLDLAVIYYISVSSTAGELKFMRITNSYAKHLGMDEQSLYEVATNNLGREGYVYKSIQDTIKAIIGLGDDCGYDMNANSKSWMNVISNKAGIYGASVILGEGVLDTIYEKAGKKDFYILPSSVHELIIVTDVNRFNAEMLSEMVMSANESRVALEERLSNQVYRYNGDKKTLSIVSGSPNSLHFASDLRKQKTI